MGFSFSWFAAPFFGAGGQSVTPPFDANDVLFWEFRMGALNMGGQTTQRAASSQFQTVLVHAKTGEGVPLTPAEIRAMGLKMAFIDANGQQVGDWHEMDVSDTTASGTYYAVAFLRVGTGGSDDDDLFDLPAGTYSRLVRVTATPRQEYELLPAFTVKGANV